MNTINLLSDARFFDDSNTRLHQLRTQLDSKSTKDKLEAMKSLTAHMTLGRDMSAFFPDVVKNVIVESQEVKKLVYMFLVTYSEHNQDLALLSINTFQKDLASPSQRIRANAMKAMSAIRIPVAIPLVMLALKSAVKDNSSYVKRAAACAIPKVHSVDTDADHYDELIAMVAELLTSIDPIVLGSALFAFNVVCPTRYDLLHRQYRKVCHLLADFDEWGQCVALEVLGRYGRTQFLSPFAKEAAGDGSDGGVASAEGGKREKKSTKAKEVAGKKQQKKAKKKSDKFYSDDDDDDSVTPSDASASESEEESEEEEVASSAPTLDDDHLLLLRQSQSLLHSPNAAVILSIATLHWFLAPSQLCVTVMPALIRLCRNKRSVQYVLLTNALTMCKARPGLFTPHVKDFYVNASDAAYVKQLKLEILSYIVNESSVVALVRELTVYAHDSDTAFVCAAIGCVGRCAVRLPSVADKCLQLLMRLVTSPVDAVVAEAVVTIRQLLQSQSSHHTAVVKRMARLLDRVRAPMARSAIVWMVGEYRELIPRMAADCLRKLSQSFRDEDETVKLQVLNLAVKLYLWRPKDVSLLFKYVMDMSKYDLSYDIRDRARLMRALFFKKKETATAPASTAAAAASAPVATGSEVKETLKQLFLIPKPAPTVDDKTAAHDRYTLGTLSQTLGVVVSGYSELPDFPLLAPTGEVRKPLEEYEAEERRERERKRATKGRGKGGVRGESESEEDESESGREEESDFSDFEDDRSESEDDDRSRSDRSDNESESDRDQEDSDRRGKTRAVASKSARNKGGSTRRDRSESESQMESSENSESDDSRDRDRRRRTQRRGRDSESESESRSEIDSEDERRKRKAKQKETAKAEKEKEKQREQREREKEKEKPKMKTKDEEKKELKDSSGKGSRDEKKAGGKVPVGDLLDLSDLTNLTSAVSQPPLPLTAALPLSPTAATSSSSLSSASSSTVTSPRSTATALSGLSVPSRGQRGQLLNPISSGGLRVDYTFSRKPSLYGKRFVAVDLLYVNESTAPFTSTALSEEDKANETASEGMTDVEAMGQLDVGQQHTVKLQVDFKGKVQPRVWRVSIGGGGDYAVRLTPDVGELVRPALLSTAEWEAKARRLSGMSEHKLDVAVSDVDRRALAQQLLAVCNMAVLAGGEQEGDGGLGVLRLSGQRLDDDDWVLLKLVVRGGGRVQCVVHCGDFMFGTSLADAAKKSLS